VESLLKQWVSMGSQAHDGEDIVMTDDDASDPEQELEKLKACFAGYQTQLDGNPWVQRLLQSLT
jgi:DNA mismatch repair protein MSH2